MESHFSSHESSDPLPKQHRALTTRPEMQFVMFSRFFLAWREATTGHQQFLGDLSADRHSKPIFLTLSLSGEGCTLLVYLHVPIKVNATSKGLRNFYVVMSAESFQTEVGSTSPAVSRFVYDAGEPVELAKAGVQTGADLLRARFVLKEPSPVVMPVPEVVKDVNERSRGLLLSLKSLSRATSFDLYIQDRDIISESMNVFLEMLCTGTMRSPEIDWKSTFNGRCWGTNSWESYGVGDEEPMPRSWNPLVEDLPPSYDRVVQTSTSRAPPIIFAEPGTHPDFSKGPAQHPGPDYCPDTESASSTIDLETDTEPADVGALDGAHRPADGKDFHQKVRDGQHISQQMTKEQHPTQEEEKERRGTRADLELNGNHQEESGKRKAGEALSDAETIIMEPRVRKWKRKTDRKRVPHRDAETLERKFDSEIDHVMEHLDLPLPPQSVFKGGPNRKLLDKVQWPLFQDAALWLSAAWTRNPSALKDYWLECNLLSQAIRLRDRFEFRNIRLKCMYMFAYELRKSEDKGLSVCALRDRPQWMAEFIFRRLGPGHDTLIMDDLCALYHSSCHWIQVGGDEGPQSPGNEREYARREQAFHLQMAACIFLALILDNRRWPMDDQQAWQKATPSGARNRASQG